MPTCPRLHALDAGSPRGRGFRRGNSHCELVNGRAIGPRTSSGRGAIDLERLASTILMDVGTLPRGYAWVFPKRDHLSVGARGTLALNQQVKAHVFKFLTVLVRQGVLGDYAVERMSCHLLPMAMPAASGGPWLHRREPFYWEMRQDLLTHSQAKASTTR